MNNETYIKALESRIVDLNGVIDSLRIQMDRLKKVHPVRNDAIIVGPVTRTDSKDFCTNYRNADVSLDGINEAAAWVALENFAKSRNLM